MAEASPADSRSKAAVCIDCLALKPREETRVEDRAMYQSKRSWNFCL